MNPLMHFFYKALNTDYGQKILPCLDTTAAEALALKGECPVVDRLCGVSRPRGSHVTYDGLLAHSRTVTCDAWCMVHDNTSPTGHATS